MGHAQSDFSSKLVTPCFLRITVEVSGKKHFNFLSLYSNASCGADRSVRAWMDCSWGLGFAEANWEDCGGKDWLDMCAGLDHLVASGIADENRLGVLGWS